MRGGFHYPADFILVADGAGWPEESFSLNLPWDGPEVKIGEVADELRASIAAARAAQIRRKQLNGRAPLMSDNYSRDLSDGAKLEIRTLLDGDCTDSHVHHVIMVARTIRRFCVTDLEQLARTVKASLEIMKEDLSRPWLVDPGSLPVVGCENPMTLGSILNLLSQHLPNSTPEEEDYASVRAILHDLSIFTRGWRLNAA